MLMHKNQIEGTDFYAFRENVDSWIKEFHGQMQEFSSVANTITETVDNTNHNYEMIRQMQQQMEQLQQELKTIKLMQLLAIKKAIQTEK